VEVSDRISLQKAGELTQHLMTCYPAEVTKPGELTIHYKPAGGKAQDFVIRYQASQMQPTVEQVKLENMEDKGIIQKWGDTIYRINFKVTAPKTTDKLSFEITAP
jgi:hypothetical protein